MKENDREAKTPDASWMFEWNLINVVSQISCCFCFIVVRAITVWVLGGICIWIIGWVCIHNHYLEVWDQYITQDLQNLDLLAMRYGFIPLVAARWCWNISTLATWCSFSLELPVCKYERNSDSYTHIYFFLLRSNKTYLHF